ncbi:MAG: TGS domain-containing protein, partial [Bdellovibrionales bacterium]|nr:TGS domain-containing protein [Bdellovibrionales bacterium]
MLMSISIRLPDNSIKTFDHNPSVLEVAESIGSRLAQDCIAGKLNGELIDLRTKLSDNDQIYIITTKSDEANEIIRHSAAHVMAQAVQEIWPKIQVTIGPVIDNGFYYDFYSPHHNFTPEDLEQIEKRMNEIVSRKLAITKEDWPSDKAIEYFKKIGEDFKAEIIKDLGSPSVSVYKQGEWLDLCRGPHVQNTSQIKALKVLSLAG